MKERVVFGFHAVLSSLRADPASVLEVLLDEQRNDTRAKDLVAAAEDARTRGLIRGTLAADPNALAAFDAADLNFQVGELVQQLQQAQPKAHQHAFQQVGGDHHD